MIPFRAINVLSAFEKTRVDETTGLTELPAKSIAEAAEEGSFTTVLTGRYDPQDMLS